MPYKIIFRRDTVHNRHRDTVRAGDLTFETMRVRVRVRVRARVRVR